jgi:hypothetical protein
MILNPKYIKKLRICFVVLRTFGQDWLVCFICKISLKNYVLTHATLHLKSFTSQKH